MDVINNIESRLKRVIPRINDTEVRNEVEAMLQRNSEFLHYPKTKVSLCGKFNAGKSALINSILSEKVVISRPISSTGVITRIFYNATNTYCVAKRLNGQTVFSDFTSGMLSDMTVKDNSNNSENVRNIVRVDIGLPNVFLKGDIELYDTPGLEDTDQTMNIITSEHLSFSDFVVFVVDAMQLKDLKDLLFKYYNRLGKNVIFVANKMDAIDDSEKQDIKDLANVYFSDYYNPITFNSDIFFVSTKELDEELLRLSFYLRDVVGANAKKISTISRLSVVRYELDELYQKLKIRIEQEQSAKTRTLLIQDKHAISSELIIIRNAITNSQLTK